MSVVVPGERIGSTADYAAGSGCYARDGVVYAAVVGAVTKTVPSASSGEKVTLVSVDRHRETSAIPYIGGNVLGQVKRINTRTAIVAIMMVDNAPVAENFEGEIRVENIRTTERDKVKVQESFRPGDIVRAKVISLGERQSYLLSTASNDLGVVFAKSIAGATMIPISWEEMQCPKTGGKQKATQAISNGVIPPYLPVTTPAIASLLSNAVEDHGQQTDDVAWRLTMQWLQVLHRALTAETDDDFVVACCGKQAADSDYGHDDDRDNASSSRVTLFIETYLRFRSATPVSHDGTRSGRASRALNMHIFLLMRRLSELAARQDASENGCRSVLQHLPVLTLLDFAKCYSASTDMAQSVGHILRPLFDARPEYMAELEDVVAVAAGMLQRNEVDMGHLKLALTAVLPTDIMAVSVDNVPTALTADQLSFAARTVEQSPLSDNIAFAAETAFAFAKLTDVCPWLGQRMWTSEAQSSGGTRLAQALISLYDTCLVPLTVCLHNCVMHSAGTSFVLSEAYDGIKRARAAIVLLFQRIYNSAFGVDADATALDHFLRSVSFADQQEHDDAADGRKRRRFVDTSFILDLASTAPDFVDNVQRQLDASAVTLTATRDMMEHIRQLLPSVTVAFDEPAPTGDIDFVHRTALISSVAELFPDLGEGFIDACLRHYGDATERVIGALLEPDLLDPSLQALDRNMPRNVPAAYTDGAPTLPPTAATSEHTESVLKTRHNIFDNDEFDVMGGAALDMSKVSRGKTGPSDALQALDDKSFVKENKDKLMIDVFYDEYDDEHDDTYDTAGTVQSMAVIDLHDVEAMEDVQAHTSSAAANRDKQAAHVSPRQADMLLYQAYQSNPSVFERSATARRSPARLQLCKSTGMSNEQIEGWFIMLEREPRRARELSQLVNNVYQTPFGLQLTNRFNTGREQHSSISKENNIVETDEFAITPVPYGFDNYCYAILDKQNNEVILVDPADLGAAVAAVDAMKGKPRMTAILTTHRHHDHCGQNGAFKKQYPDITIYGGVGEGIPSVDTEVGHEQEFQIGSLRFKSFITPCHTRASTLYLLQQGSKPALFTGDTLFKSGVGKFYEGNAAEMLAVVQFARTLPPQTTWWPGHEYALKNLQWAAVVEPQNAAIKSELQSVQERRQTKPAQCCVPTTLAQELETNPYIRYNEAAVREYAQKHASARGKQVTDAVVIDVLRTSHNEK
ncbi:Cytoplasmic glyoxalase II [Sorochytrium milnesiophthora]